MADQLLLLEQLQRVTNRLARHAERTAQLFLADALAAGAVDKRRLRVERLQ
jgi:hypothetical protein